MRPTVNFAFRRTLSSILTLMLLAFGCVATANANSIPRPEAIQPDVNFWIRVYTEVTTNEGFLHDERNLAVVYDSSVAMTSAPMFTSPSR